MPTRRLTVTTSLVLALLLSFTGASAAQGGHADLAPPSLDGTVWQVEPEHRVAQRGCMSLSQAVSRARSQNPGGRVISAETKRRGNRVTHVVKILTSDGKVRTRSFPGCS